MQTNFLFYLSFLKPIAYKKLGKNDRDAKKSLGFSPDLVNKLRYQPNEHRQPPIDMWKEGEKSESAHKLPVHWVPPKACERYSLIV